MSGGLLSSFRKGNTAELLADYLLSSIGICTPVRRQDDCGFDCYCQLSQEEEGYMTFGHPFIIQIKSSGNKPLKYGNSDPKYWKHENVSWLFRNKLPFFIGVVDTERISLSIYDTTGIWHVYNCESYTHTQIELRPSPKPEREARADVAKSKIDDWPEDKGDGVKYIVDIGAPIVEIRYDDLQDEKALARKKMALISIISIEQTNIINRELGIRAFITIKHNVVNVPNVSTSMSLSLHPLLNIEEVYRSLKVPFISVMIKLRKEGRMQECEAVKNVLKHMPLTNIDHAMYATDPILFDYLKDKFER